MAIKIPKKKTSPTVVDIAKAHKATAQKAEAKKALKGEGMVVAEWPRGEAERVRINLSVYMGCPMVSLRIWTMKETPSGEIAWRPSKRGVTFQAQRLSEIEKALRAARRTAETLGLIEPEDEAA